MEATGDTGSISPSQHKENSTDSEQEQTTSQKDATSISSELKEDAVQSESNEIRLLNFAKSEFNKNRKIIIRNVPPVTYDEVKDFLGGYKVDNITISKKSRHAIITLLSGEEAEELVASIEGRTLLDTEVEVEIFPNEQLLCVAHLPFNFNDDDFKSLVTPYGGVERCFLMRSENTGSSKGYGFVEFSHNKENSGQAKNMLDGKRFGSCVIHCDFVDQKLVTYASFNSKCLFVDHLPSDYRNIMEFRNIFSKVVNPIYCQIAMRNGQALGFAIVEYSSSEQAEATQRMVHGYEIDNQRIRVTYCIPGQSAMEVYNRLINALNGGLMRASLLPNPVMPNPTALQNPTVHNLLQKHPQLMKNFQQTLQQLANLQQTSQNSSSKSQIGGATKQGLLGSAPNLPGYGFALNPLMNPMLQAALIAVLSAQMQQPSQQQQSLLGNTQLMHHLDNLFGTASMGQKPSLLGNPVLANVVGLVQSLVSQLPMQLIQTAPPPPPPDTDTSEDKGDDESTDDKPTTTPPASEKSQELAKQNEYNLNLVNNLSQVLENLQKNITGGENSQSYPDSASSEPKPCGLLGDAPPGVSNMGAAAHSGLVSGNKHGLLPHPDQGQNQPMVKTGLLGEGPNMPGSNQDPTNPAQKLAKHTQSFSNPLLAFVLGNQIQKQMQIMQAISDAKNPTPSTSGRQGLLGNGPDNHDSQEATGSRQTAASNSNMLNQMGGTDSMGLGNGSTYSQHLGKRKGLLGDGPDNKGAKYNSDNQDSSYNYKGYGDPSSNQSYGNSDYYNNYGYGYDYNSGYGDMNQTYGDYNNYMYGNQDYGYGHDYSSYGQAASQYNQGYSWDSYQKSWEAYSAVYQDRSGENSEAVSSNPLPEYQASQHEAYQTYNSVYSASKTPVGSKRSSAHLIPSPEQSPEGNYIGQHSQGIGGHYADSYFKRRKLNDS